MASHKAHLTVAQSGTCHGFSLEDKSLIEKVSYGNQVLYSDTFALSNYHPTVSLNFRVYWWLKDKDRANVYYPLSCVSARYLTTDFNFLANRNRVIRPRPEATEGEEEEGEGMIPYLLFKRLRRILRRMRGSARDQNNLCMAGTVLVAEEGKGHAELSFTFNPAATRGLYNVHPCPGCVNEEQEDEDRESLLDLHHCSSCASEAYEHAQHGTYV